MASSALHSVFITYYVSLFKVYRLEDSAFYVGQAVYLTWNSMNDLLFVWLLDRVARRHAWYRRRHLWVIGVGGGMWAALGFLLPFYPLWSISGGGWPLAVHFALSLCVYDTCLSAVMLSHNALLADMTVSPTERTKCTAWSSTFGALGCSTVFLGHLFWTPGSAAATASLDAAAAADGAAAVVGQDDGLGSFRIFCAAVGLVSVGLFQFTQEFCEYDFDRNSGPNYKRVERDLEGGPDNGVDWEERDRERRMRQLRAVALRVTETGVDSNDPDPAETVAGPPSTVLSPLSLISFAGQLWRQPNFVIFVSVNFIQVFNCHFNSNFLTVWVSLFLGTTSKFSQSLLVALSVLIPHVLVVIAAPVVSRLGVASVISNLFWFKCLLAIGAVLLAGQASSWYPDESGALSPFTAALCAVYMLSNKSFSEAICRLSNLSLADVIDEDRSLHNRGGLPASSVIHGVNALLTKPGQSLAPMLGWYLLRDLDPLAATRPVSTGTVPRSATGSTSLYPAFLVMATVPLACAVLQLVLWSRFGATASARAAKVNIQ